MANMGRNNQQFYPGKQIIASESHMQLIRQNSEELKRVKHYAYSPRDMVGSGNFSKVYKATNTKTNQTVAIKVVSLDLLKSRHLESFILEQINILKMVKHPNILTFQEVMMSERNCYLVTELCQQGNLQQTIKNKRLSNAQLASIVADVYRGLKYLREMGICHRDIKAANIFMNQGRAKIADFGLAKLYKYFLQYNRHKFKDLDIGSPYFMSPEGIIHNTYSQKTDIWSFGIFIYELLHGQSPFTDCKREIELKNAVIQQIPQQKFRQDIQPLLRQLINSLLTIKEEDRPSVFDLVKNPYIKSITCNNCYSPVKRQTCSAGLNIVQVSKVSIGRSKKQKNEDSNQKTEGFKSPGDGEFTPKKIIELGLGSRKRVTPRHRIPSSAYTPPPSDRNLPFSMKSIMLERQFYVPPQSVQEVGRFRANSTKTIETKQSESERQFQGRSHRIYSHLRT